MTMRVLLFGGTQLSLAVANRLVSMGLAPVGVVLVGPSFPISYRPQGVTNVKFADLASWALERGIPTHHHDDAEATASFAAGVRAEFGLLAGWFHMVGRSLRAQFRLGCAGLHASLLPKFRGGAPLNWALLAGEASTGVSLFELGDGVDDGPLYGQRRFPIHPRSAIGELVTAAETAAVDLVQECLPRIADGSLTPDVQIGTPSYCLQRFPEDGWIEWSRPAEEIDRLVRAVGRPYPGASTRIGADEVLVWDAEPLLGVTVYGMPGQLARLPGELDPCVVTGDGMLVIRDATDRAGRSVLPQLRAAAHQRFVRAASCRS